MNNSVYNDIARRTDGNIYIGVVGPVRSGKSTLIKKFMEELVIPEISDENRRERAVDELPQSAAGKTIMTTEPKFIPEEAVEINLEGEAKCRVRMIDCVGYIIPSAIGYIENEAPRMVKTPWFDDEVPFNMAAEVGTHKVITEHSTIGLVVTTDGSVTDLPRDEYEECEERVINELKEIGKPFVVLLNCVEPDTIESQTLRKDMEEKYGCPVLAVNCLDLDKEEINRILTDVLYSFPISEINISMPCWINSLEKGHWLKDAIFSHIKKTAEEVKTLRDLQDCAEKVAQCEYITSAKCDNIDLGTGSGIISATLDESLFYKIIGEVTGLEIKDENDLMPKILELVKIRAKYQKYSAALEEMEKTGYGTVNPERNEYSLEQPEIMKQGNKYGVRLKASAPVVHMIKTEVHTEVAPIVGSEKQSEELAAFMLTDFEENPEKLWESNILGKSLEQLVSEGFDTRMDKLPVEARMKIRETIERMINEGCSGLICLIL